MGDVDLPTGQEVVLAIGKFDNFGIEDAVVISQAAVDRGLFRSFMLRKYSSTVRSTATDRVTFGVPDPSKCSAFKAGSKTKLNPLVGAPDPSTTVDADTDTIIGKYTSRKLKSSRNDPDAKGSRIVDQSTLTRKPGTSRVEYVRASTNVDGSKMVTVGARQERTVQVGDKITDRHAQKGCCSFLAAAEDLPFTKDGVTPDVIVSPCQFPSRMTVAKIIELVAAKSAALTGKPVDLTPFRELGDFEADLINAGFHWSAKEVMYDAHTGRKIQNPVAIGIVNYRKLRHMVEDKIHSRSLGPMLHVLQQPVEGRGRDGALRLGEMERDTLLAHGAASVLTDRLQKCSDGKEFVMCPKCSNFAEALPEDADGKGTEAQIDGEWYYCRVCAGGAAAPGGANAAQADVASPDCARRPVEVVALPQAVYLMKHYMDTMQLSMGF